MSKTAEALAFMEKRGGIARWSDLVDAGFSPGLVASMADRGKIDCETRGVYTLPDIIADEPEAITARWGRAVVSHSSALYLHGLSGRLPLSTDITVPREYNASAITRAYPNITLHRCGKETYPLGIQTMEGLAGVPVRVYDSERCVCDILALRKRGEVDVQLLKDAVGGYLGSPECDLPKIASYARALRVENELQRYTEVLL